MYVCMYVPSPTGECAAQKHFCSSSLFTVLVLSTCLHHMVIIRSQNKITDFFYDFRPGHVLLMLSIVHPIHVGFLHIFFQWFNIVFVIIINMCMCTHVCMYACMQWDSHLWRYC